MVCGLLKKWPCWLTLFHFAKLSLTVLTHPGFHSHILRVLNKSYFSDMSNQFCLIMSPRWWVCSENQGTQETIGESPENPSEHGHTYVGLCYNLSDTPQKNKQLISCIPFYPMISHEITIFNVFSMRFFFLDYHFQWFSHHLWST